MFLYILDRGDKTRVAVNRTQIAYIEPYRVAENVEPHMTTVHFQGAKELNVLGKFQTVFELLNDEHN